MVALLVVKCFVHLVANASLIEGMVRPNCQPVVRALRSAIGWQIRRHKEIGKVPAADTSGG